MAFGIHPDQLGYIEAIKRGDKIVWHSPLRWLTCFAPDFDAHREEYTHDWVFPGVHENVYPRYDVPRGLVGVKLCTLEGALALTNVLEKLDDAESLSPLDVLEYCIVWLGENSDDYQTMNEARRAKFDEKTLLTRQFLQAYPLRIPREVWRRALPKQAS